MKYDRPLKSREIALSACKCEPVARMGTIDGKWTIRLTMESMSPRGFVPLFVHVFRQRNGNFGAEIESDQTDYNTDRSNVKSVS